MAARKPCRMTPARRAALKRAQLISARKRKGSGKAATSKSRPRAKALVSKGKAPKSKRVTPQNLAKTLHKKPSQPAGKKPSHLRRHGKKYVAGAVAVGAIAGSAYVYKHRERLVISKEAERRAVRDMQKHTLATKGRKMTKEEIHEVKMTERREHKGRSTLRVREYGYARKLAKHGGKLAKEGTISTNSLRPDRKNNIYDDMARMATRPHKDTQRHFLSLIEKMFTVVPFLV